MSADRNLLFGILAVQSGFCTGPQLVEAMNAWTLAKARPLGAILLERGFLKQNEHDLIAALVALQIEKHDGDLDKSLAALSPMPRLAAELRRIGDVDLQQSMAAFPTPTADDADRTRSFESVPFGDVGRYRILRPHARGGLGEVYVARDEELGREVALKEIQAQHANNMGSRGRFVREAEVTGGLEHPGIVAVYGLGTYGDGRPFYAMRFIHGDSLKEAIERFHKSVKPDFSGSEFRQLLGRFIDVCQAIAYAHSRGVLHRDLKPGNIMLGKFGETLVVDWGLAKVVGTKDIGHGDGTLSISSDNDSMLTQQGETIGTPAFMSPEQASGRLDELGPATDVYSLGATLYSILANRAPIEGRDKADRVRKAARGDWTPLGIVDPRIPAPLAAICAKAMALHPTSRYASTEALASDVERFLGDEPIVAYRDPILVRVGRWTRKHPTVAVSITTALLFGAAAMGGFWAVERERNTYFDTLYASLLDARREDREFVARLQSRSYPYIPFDNAVMSIDAVVGLIVDTERHLDSHADAKPLREFLKKANERLDTIMLRVAKQNPSNPREYVGIPIHQHLGERALLDDPRRAKAHFERACRLQESSLSKFQGDHNSKYVSACAWALVWRATNADKSLPEAERKKALAEYKANALDRLRTAVTLGFSNAWHIAIDPDLAELRTWPEYEEILAKIKANEAKKMSKAPELKGK